MPLLLHRRLELQLPHFPRILELISSSFSRPCKNKYDQNQSSSSVRNHAILESSIFRSELLKNHFLCPVKNGFRKSGLFLFDPNAIDRKRLIPSDESVSKVNATTPAIDVGENKPYVPASSADKTTTSTKTSTTEVLNVLYSPNQSDEKETHQFQNTNLRKFKFKTCCLLQNEFVPRIQNPRQAVIF